MNENHPTFEKCTICGATNFAKYVVIPHEEWETIKRDLRGVLKTVQSPPDKRTLRKSPIVSDKELSDFLMEHQNTHTLDELVKMSEEKFGIKRAPSRSSISRYFRRVWREKHTEFS